MKERIYVCHTYYHVYVTFLKELNLPREKRGQATLVLSRLSNDFENLKQRVEKTGLFEEVVEFDEKRDDFFPELKKYREDQGNIVFNMLSRIRFTRKYAKLEEAYIPVDFREYGDIYVFCDTDPIGYYLNQKKIYYHAVEDGLNSIANCDEARFENRGHFALKAWMSRKWNLIFVQNGYGKYCIDMEVNDISAIHYPCPRYVEVSRQSLTDALTQEDTELILSAFLRNREEFMRQLEESSSITNKILILTEPLCSLDVRERIFRDLITRYEKEGQVFLKPHPRDLLDYGKLFPGYPMIDGTVPMELLNFFPVHFKKVISVFTEMKAVQFADEIVALGADFMDEYEEPSIHRQNERI